jgi:hypothetical protein
MHNMATVQEQSHQYVEFLEFDCMINEVLLKSSDKTLDWSAAVSETENKISRPDKMATRNGCYHYSAVFATTWLSDVQLQVADRVYRVAELKR